ncbi:interferon-inducible double-stranded RNA-dependent protein kinase activator A homolog [Phymastichus coffea]|uniref:interferon-inducible double-stranded RNA-dependent protein kinase activator A homolog n=1 Tax=Phymastichus coffea TaxID=108790 RepID=UPI00273B8200|nr:interferon-inducible double-stranded RNA-dependent protein kinase activator A homolog [Phymastichus coffea]
MDKHPISLLQECMIKRHIIPKYSLIESTTGSHSNWFKIRVECGQNFAEGEGSTKKCAKGNAAKEMIRLLNLSTSNGFLSPNRIIDNAIDTKIISSNNNPISKPQNSTTFYTTDTSINYIGKLQEIAQKTSIMLPEYIDKLSVGPMHQLKFTISCKFNNMEEEAVASTKKEAKILAAKQMLERITNDNLKECKPEQELNSYLESIDQNISSLKISENNESSMAQLSEKALKLFLPMSKNNFVKKVNLQNTRSYNSYHTFLRDAFCDTVRELVIDKLEDTIRACQAYKNAIGATDPMILLRLALKELNIDVTEVVLASKEETVILVLQLNTVPIISEIGHGPTKSIAIVQCVMQMATTVAILIA